MLPSNAGVITSDPKFDSYPRNPPSNRPMGKAIMTFNMMFQAFLLALVNTSNKDHIILPIIRAGIMIPCDMIIFPCITDM